MTTTAQPTVPVAEKHLPKSILSRDSIHIRRIAVPVDLTSDTQKGVDPALHLARRFGADLFLVHVYKEPYPLSHVSGPICYDACEHHRFNTELDILALRDQLRKQYPRCFAIFREGTDITREISAVAKEINADLIVVPAHHQNWFEYLCEGSYAEGIVRKAPCPVLIIHEGKEPQAA
jgi:nucleotide-binding universal stress UspA family protein